MSLTEIILAPVLWNRASREHSEVCKRHKLASIAYRNGTGSIDDTWKWYYASWEPYNRTFRYLPAALAMLCIYGIGLLVLVYALVAWLNS